MSIFQKQAKKIIAKSAENKLLAALHEFLNVYGEKRTYWIAFSGGLDSHVLLSLCHAINQKQQYKWHAIHINHGLSINADSWGLNCARICKNYGINYIERSLQLIKKKGESLENIAREKRYAIFAEYLKSGDMLLSAHHQDDQAETLLMQLCRGSGLSGLSAMPTVKPFALGFHGRPLLKVPRSVLLEYAKEQKLNWIEDESNQNLQLTRNFIRHQILPLLKTRFPSVTKTLSRVASLCAKADQFIDASLKTLAAAVSNDNQTLSVTKLLLLNQDQQQFILRQWIEQKHYPMPSEKKLIAIQQNVLTAAWDRNPCVKWQHVELRRYRDQLFLQPALTKHDETEIFTWNFQKPLELTSIGNLHAVKTLGRGLRTDIKQVFIQYRRGGEVVLLGKRGRHSLKKLFQEWGVPPWERSRLPLIFIEPSSHGTSSGPSHMIGIVGYFLNDNYCVKENEMGWEIYLT